MKHQRHFESETASKEAAQIRTLVADLGHIVRILNCEIATAEEIADLFDRSQPEYPMVARTLAARRDNLENTIASLEQRLATVKA